MQKLNLKIEEEITQDFNILHKKSRETTIEECKELKVFEKLEEILKNKKGIGLAAIQLNCPIKAAILRIPNKEPMNLYNPKIIEKKDPIKFSERCLSIPGLDILTRRYNDITFENGDGQRYSAEGIEAICVQHEIDHIEGKTILDRKWRKRK